MLLGLAFSPAGEARIGKSYRAWAKGPVRWLMLPEEERAFRRLRDDSEAALFVREFWERRDPQPQEPGNLYLDRFWERVSIADRLYTRGSVRGSLTDRGRAQVLLGAPSALRVGQQPAPSWPQRDTGRSPRYSVEHLRVEVWEYGVEVLPTGLEALLRHERGAAGAELTFVIDGDEARLVDGERLLELAARAAVMPPPPPQPEPAPQALAESPG